MPMALPDLAQELLAWYATAGREMPWRIKGTAHNNPYAVWISEIMLQQTTVATVVDYFIRWMRRFPTITDLAAADIDDVLLMWQGLGYYTRARKIHACAKILVADYNGKLPDTREELLKLPGIGPYSASSICAFAFNKPETVVDGNVMRVIARLYGLTDCITPALIYPLAQKLTSPTQPADYASAIMDLGATVCLPAQPLCSQCPWQKWCVACQKNLTAVIPVIKKTEKKQKTGFVYLMHDTHGAYLIEKRNKKGLLNGLYEFPWAEQELPFTATDTHKTITHTFTHFKLTLHLMTGKINPKKGQLFVSPADFEKYPFSTLMQKVIKKANLV